MIWLKHMILVLAAAVMTAAPAMSCCMPDQPSASEISKSAEDAQKNHHSKQDISATSHPCDEPSNITNKHHPNSSENNDSACNGCADCTYMAAQAKVHFSAIQIKIDHEPEHLIQFQVLEILAQPPVLTRFIKPPATAPPLALSPIHLKQILIV